MDLECPVHRGDLHLERAFRALLRGNRILVLFIKVAAIVLFILIGGCAVFGVLPIQGYDHAPLFENFVKDGLFPNGWMPVFTTMLTVNFAFSGTELIGVTAGETKDPDKAIPKASHTTCSVSSSSSSVPSWSWLR